MNAKASWIHGLKAPDGIPEREPPFTQDEIRALRTLLSEARKPRVVRQVDESRANLEALMTAWRAMFGEDAATAAEAVRVGWEAKSPAAMQLDLALRAISRQYGTSPPNQRFLGKYLRHRVGVELRGFAFIRSGERNHSALWRLQRIQN